MEIVPRTVWKAKHAPIGPATLPASELWLHHAGTPISRQPETPAEERAKMRALEAFAKSKFDTTFSYTFAVMPSGRVYEGHGVGNEGSHTKKHNKIARAIVVVGCFHHDPQDPTAVPHQPTSAALESVAQLVVHGFRSGWWQAPALNGGHRDVPAGTSCPGDFLHPRVGEINSRAAAIMAGKAAPDAPQVDDDGGGMQTLVKVKGHTAVFVTNGISRRWVQTKAEKTELVKLGLVDDRTHDITLATLKRLTLIGPEPPAPK